MLKIDVNTVETLQLLAPGISLKDRITVKGLVHSGGVFSNFTTSQRSSIWKQMKKKEGIIPSLHTFFKDLWYLESCANCMKRLIIPTKCSPTIKSAMRAAFLSFDPANARFLIQTSETGFRRYAYSQADPAELGYRQLWLYAMRHYPRLSRKPQKKDPAAKPNREVADQTILYDMAVLARRLGFKSPQIEQLIKQSPDRQIAQDALLRARRPDCYQYNEGEFECLIDRVTECFLKAIPLDHQPPAQCVGGRETKKESRCGYPQAKAQSQDRRFLFIDQIHGGSFSAMQKVSSLFVRRNVYFNFFGKLSLPEANNATDEPPNQGIPISPLFVPSELSHQDERRGGDGVEERGQLDGSFEQQRLKEVRRERRQQKREKKARRRQQKQQRKRQPSRAERHSRYYPRNMSGRTSASDMVISRVDSMESRGPEEGLESRMGSNAGSNTGSSSRIGRELVLRDAELAMVDQFERESPVAREHIVSEQEGSEIGILESELGPVQPQGGVGERVARRESLEDVNMGEHRAAESAEGLSPVGEDENTLEILEGRGASIPAEVQGPARIGSRKSAALREGTKWNPYKRTQRRREQSPKLSEPPPQETLEQQINTLLEPRQTAIQEQSTRPVTQIDFRAVQLHTQPETDDGQNQLPEKEERNGVASRQMFPDMSPSTSASAVHLSQMQGSNGSVMETPTGEAAATSNLTVLVGQDGQTPDHQDRPSGVPAEALGSSKAEIEPDIETPRPIDQQSRRHGLIISPSEPREQNPEPVPERISPQISSSAATSQHETVTQSEHLLSSQAGVMDEASTSQAEATREEAARTEQLSGGPDGPGDSRQPEDWQDQGKRVEPSGATELTGVTIMFRARNENGEWDRVVHQMVVDPSDPSPVERMAKKNARKRNATFYDRNLRTLAPTQCFDAAIEDGTKTIFVTFDNELAVDEETMESVTRALESDTHQDDRPVKRRL